MSLKESVWEHGLDPISGTPPPFSAKSCLFIARSSTAATLQTARVRQPSIDPSNPTALNFSGQVIGAEYVAPASVLAC
jgi:hypothetical protein